MVMHMLCGALLLLLDSVAHGRMLPDNVIWAVDSEDEQTMQEVFHHTRRQLQAAPYCVAASGADQTKLQDALDWACGPVPNGGGVNCDGILQTGSCYSPNTLQDHASYAFNLYYVQQKGASNSCDFGGLATTTFTDPSKGSCIYTSLGSSGSSPSTGTNSSTTPFSSTPSPSNNTFGSTTTGSTSDAMGRLTLSWVHICCTFMAVLLLAFRL